MSCPNETPILLNSVVCVNACPLGFIQSSEDETECVQDISCPETFSVIANSNVECTKPKITIVDGQNCPAGYEEWISNECYKNCPVNFISNGLTCMKQTVTRDGSTPTSEFSLLPILISFLCFIGLLWLGYTVLNHVKFSTEHLSQEDLLLRKINTYFLQKTSEIQ